MNLKWLCKPILKSCKSKTKVKRRPGIISHPTVLVIEEHPEKITKTYPKTLKEEDLIRNAIQDNRFLSNIFEGSRVQTFIDMMYSREVTKGELLIKQGEVGSHLYISNKGTYEVLMNNTRIQSFEDVRVFGELAILYNAKRHATIRCLEDGRVWVLDCPVFKQLTVKSALEEQEEIVSFLKNVPKLNSASMEKLYILSNLLKCEFFSTSTEIVREGEIGDTFYIIRDGSATVYRNNFGKISQLTKGQFFGEMTLLTKGFRESTVQANYPGTECLTLTRKQFTDCFGDLDDFLNLDGYPCSSRIEKIAKYENISLHDFEILKTLGVGGFGRVELIRHARDQYLVFALKYMKKQDIMSKSHQEQLYNEKNLQLSCDCPFIVRLYRTFRDLKYLYLLLEPCLGGDLWNLLHRQKKQCFEESAARFYAACVLEALGYLHEHAGIIYRDLKPENVVVDSNGYLKLTDFGFAKKVNKHEKTYTFVGTAEYVAPEIIQNKGHNKGVDYWAFGVFIYELLVGRSPFRTNDPGNLMTYKLILRGIDHIEFPFIISPKAKNLIKKLCKPLSMDRLGCLKGGVGDIKNHPWFSRFNWEQLQSLQMKPPFRIYLTSNTDTRYFEKFKEDTNIPLDDHSTWDNNF